MGGQNSKPNASGKRLEKLTFGVELEFLAFAPQKTKIEEYISQKLTEPVTLPCNKPGCTEKSHQWRLPAKRWGGWPFESDYTRWTISHDPSLCTDFDYERPALNRNKSHFAPMEIQSRILNFVGTTPDPFGQRYPCTNEIFEWTWREEIAAFLQALTNAFARPGYRLHTNYSTGLHVHLGNDGALVPLKVAQGILGAFAGLERQFDAILPVSRIYGYQGSLPIPGLDASRSAWYHDDINQGFYSRSVSSAMYTHLEMQAKKALNENADVTNILQSCNVPAWLEMIGKVKTYKALLDFDCGHNQAVNLENMSSEPEVGKYRMQRKETVEVRLHHGSLDTAEITAWCDLLGHLTLWVDSSDSFDFYLQAWANPSSTILDLVHQVCATQTTIDFYTNRLTPLWTQRRHDRLIGLNHPDELHALTRAVEYNRLIEYSPMSVKSKIVYKLRTGAYGQLPASFLNAKLSPTTLLTSRGRSLCIESDDWSAVSNTMISVFRSKLLAEQQKQN